MGEELQPESCALALSILRRGALPILAALGVAVGLAASAGWAQSPDDALNSETPKACYASVQLRPNLRARLEAKDYYATAAEAAAHNPPPTKDCFDKHGRNRCVAGVAAIESGDEAPRWFASRWIPSECAVCVRVLPDDLDNGGISCDAPGAIALDMLPRPPAPKLVVRPGPPPTRQ